MRDFVFYDGMISYDGELLAYDDFIRQLHLETDGHGTISASHTTGMSGDTVTLTNTPDQYYIFDNYTTTGGTIVGSTFTFGDDDDQTARANFKRNSYVTGGTLIGVQASEVFKTGGNETISPFRDNNSETTA
ncbi:InlB B-repeat-containing protein, partial [Ralstonia pseudosolanacearum]|uniref:InlB B-repeat-containing protein n=1 Tax=Ralstonia pseudosolanacearum TaxID=1310165 RepID=UPI003CFB2C21